MFFDFKQFRIYHDRCAMKVGTDGVLLGAWAPFYNPSLDNSTESTAPNSRTAAFMNVLDIGTGSGLLALMIAQRYPTARITAIDIDAEAAAQAADNALASPFANRITVVHASIQDFAATQQHPFSTTADVGCRESFQAIICNPPFFENSLLAPDAQRATARHASTLSFDELISTAALLLADGGQFAVVLPSEAFTSFHHLCFASGMNLEAECQIHTTSTKPPKRILACFRKGPVHNVSNQHLTLTVDGHRSPDYAALTADFYIK